MTKYEQLLDRGFVVVSPEQTRDIITIASENNIPVKREKWKDGGGFYKITLIGEVDD